MYYRVPIISFVEPSISVGNPETSVTDKGKPPTQEGAAVNALSVSAAAEEGGKIKPASDEARAARSAVAIASFLNTSLSSPRAGERKVCSFFLRGCCRFGDSCRNSHHVDLEENASDFGGKTKGDEVGREALTDALEGGEGDKNVLTTKETALDEAERIQVSYFETYRVLMLFSSFVRGEEPGFDFLRLFSPTPSLYNAIFLVRRVICYLDVTVYGSQSERERTMFSPLWVDLNDRCLFLKRFEK